MFKSDKLFLDLSLILTISTFLLFSPLAFTQSIPPYIYYQGKLLDQATGAPVNQIKSITFSLYNTNEGGTPIYQQTQDINITNGVFSVYLGQGEGSYNGNPVADGIPSEAFIEHSARYLGIRIEDSQIEMTPRQLIASAAYAYKAERASKADYAMKATEAENVMGQVTVSPSGNVGIGTTNPVGLLDVGGGNLVVDPNSGNVGIGTTGPNAKLEVIPSSAGGTGIQIPYEAGNLSILKLGYNYVDADENHLYLKADGQTVMCLRHSTGNVGIGTTNPRTKLELSGHNGVNGLILNNICIYSSGTSGSGISCDTACDMGKPYHHARGVCIQAWKASGSTPVSCTDTTSGNRCLCTSVE